MIRVNYSQEGSRYRLAVTGHAGYSANGNDIVCAGVSAISYALLGYLQNSPAVATEAHMDSGDLMIDCTGPETICAVFEMALIGYLQISKKYPQCVDVYISAAGG